MIIFHLSTRSNVPPYAQVVEQVRHALLTDVLKPGDKLPSVKEVVSALAINPNTVLKAYRDLEREGLVEGRQGVGTFVLRRPDGPGPSEQTALVRVLTSWVTRARGAGLSDADIESMVRAVLRASDAAAIA